jgi:hypothetical protein
MPNKIILLTIFLYITLNLRKIENFIQNGYKIESFTAEKAERAALVSLETRMQIALLKIVGLSMLIYYQAPKIGVTGLAQFQVDWKIGIIVFMIMLFGVLIAVLYITNMLDLQWMTTLENVINEFVSMTFIYVAVKIAMRDSEKNTTVASSEVLESYAKRLNGLLDQLAPEPDAADKSSTTTGGASV